MDQDGYYLESLNELEIINQNKLNNYLFANVFQSDIIYMISISKAKVVASWNLKELSDIQWENTAQGSDWRNAVLNGIAYHSPTDSFIITGKMWDFIW